MNAHNGVVTEWNGVGGISRGNLKEETAENDLGGQFFMRAGRVKTKDSQYAFTLLMSR